MSDLNLFYHEVRRDIAELNSAEKRFDDTYLRIAEKYILLFRSEDFEDDFKTIYGEKQMICVRGVINCMDMVRSFNEKLITKDFVLQMLIGIDKIGAFWGSRGDRYVKKE